MNNISNESPMKSYEFQFSDGQLPTENLLKSFYTKRFSDLINMIDQKQLFVHKLKFPDQSVCKINTCFVIDRYFTSNLERIFTKMQGLRYRSESNNGKVHHFDKFSYLDGYYRPDKTLGIRAIKVTKNEDLDDGYSRYYPYIFVHFYARQDSTYPKKQKRYYGFEDTEENEDIEIEIDEECLNNTTFQEQKPEVKKQNQEPINVKKEQVNQITYFEAHAFAKPSYPAGKEIKIEQPFRKPQNNNNELDEEIFQLNSKLLEKRKQISKIQIQICDVQEYLSLLKLNKGEDDTPKSNNNNQHLHHQPPSSIYN